jgi:hypothetical protein
MKKTLHHSLGCRLGTLIVKISILTALFMCFMPDQGQCQITVTNSNNASILAQKLVGPGVIISNTTVQCNGNQSGVFVTTSSNLGIDSGIVLTTGFAASSFPAFGVNGAQTNFASANQGTGIRLCDPSQRPKI